MNLSCPYSGLYYKIPGFTNFPPISQPHPIFSVPQSTLLSPAQITRWAEQSLTAQECYLYFLALLRSSELVTFRSPAIYISQDSIAGILQQAVIATCMERLLRLLEKQSLLPQTTHIFPRLVISNTIPETQNLSAIPDWLGTWEQAIQDAVNAYKSISLSQKIITREHALERLIKSPDTAPHVLANQLAEWAALAGAFPSTQTQYIESQKREMTLGEYWKLIIRACAKEERIWYIPKQDLEELISHCEDNIPHGSIYASALMRFLRNGRSAQFNYLGLGDIDLSPVSNACVPFRILDGETSKEDANKLAIIDTAPSSPPIRKDYPSEMAFIAARLKYDMAVKYRAQLEENRKKQAEADAAADNFISSPESDPDSSTESDIESIDPPNSEE